MKTNIFIPKKCKVGFNPRPDTYTGMLGYIIYNDGKVWRKETSWLGWIYTYVSEEEFDELKHEAYESEIARWLNTTPNSYLRSSDANYGKYQYRFRNGGYGEWKYVDEKITDRNEIIDKVVGSYEDFSFQIQKRVTDSKINPVEFDNEPTEGFVLNKKAGGYSTGWNHRQTYCRVYDPRGFEFEITIPNLLYILENTNSIKGKGLDGMFVYGWDGKDLVLLPEASPEYEEMVNFTKLQNESISKKDMIRGGIYLDSNNHKVTYLGDGYEYNNYRSEISASKKMWFNKPYDDKTYIIGTLDIKSIKRYTGEIDDNLVNLLDSLEKKSEYYNGNKNDLFHELNEQQAQSKIRSSVGEYYSRYNKFTGYIKDTKGQFVKIEIRFANRLRTDYEVTIGRNNSTDYKSISEILKTHKIWELKMIK